MEDVCIVLLSIFLPMALSSWVWFRIGRNAGRLQAFRESDAEMVQFRQEYLEALMAKEKRIRKLQADLEYRHAET